MERCSFTLKDLCDARVLKLPRGPQLPTTPLLAEAEVLHIAHGVVNGLLHLHVNAFAHRYRSLTLSLLS
jgi:hypothetical protein